MVSRRDFLKFMGCTPAFLYSASLAPMLCACRTSESATLSGIVDWEALRESEFSLSGNHIYMNNSTLGPTLNRVTGSMAAVQQLFASGLSPWDFVREIVFAVSPIRDAFTRLVNAHVDATGKSAYVGIVDSVTDGMSLVANGLNFRPGDGILITDHEHTGGKTMWKLQQDRYQAVVHEIPLMVEGESGEEWAEGLLSRFEDYLKTHAVKVVSFSYITTSTGHVLPVQKLCALAKHYGAISVVDAAQAFAVLPIDVVSLDCDFLVVNGHKYLCGPVGTGFICVHPRMLEVPGTFWPTIVDDNYYNPDNPARSNPIRKGGLKAFTNILPLAGALEFYHGLGAETVYGRLLAIGQWLRTGLSRYPDSFDLLTPSESDASCVMTCFRINGMASQAAVDALLDGYNIIAKHATEGGADAIRLSPHHFTTEKELDQAARAICELANVSPDPWFEGNALAS